jgi:hypothetical protein
MFAEEAGFRTVWLKTHNCSVVYDLDLLSAGTIKPDFTIVAFLSLPSLYEYSIKTDAKFISTSLQPHNYRKNLVAYEKLPT